MKILHVISSMNPKGGGVAQAVRDIVKGLNKLGVYNEVVCLDSPNAEYLKHDEFIVFPLGVGKTNWNYSPALFSWLKANLSNYNIVIVHGLWQYQSWAVYSVWKKLVERPYIYVMPHGMLDPYFQRAKGRKLKAIRNWIFWKIIENKIIHAAEGLLFTCEEEKFLARITFSPYTPKSEQIVGLGVESPPAFTPVMQDAFNIHCQLPVGAPYLLFLSRIHEKKGVDILINAYVQLQQEGVNVPHLVIAGPGLDTLHGESIQKLAERSETIYFPGMLSGNAKWGAFYGCEAFILPSHQENFGIAVVEALACCKPVLISDQVNIWKEIINEQGGIVANDNEEGVYILLKTWLQLSLEERSDMKNKAYRTYQKYFAVDQANMRMKKVLDQIL